MIFEGEVLKVSPATNEEIVNLWNDEVVMVAFVMDTVGGGWLADDQGGGGVNTANTYWMIYGKSIGINFSADIAESFNTNTFYAATWLILILDTQYQKSASFVCVGHTILSVCSWSLWADFYTKQKVYGYLIWIVDNSPRKSFNGLPVFAYHGR